MNFFILLIDLFHYHFMFKLNFYTIFDIWSQNYCYNVGRRRFIFLNLWMYFENLMEIWTIWDPYCSLSWSKKSLIIKNGWKNISIGSQIRFGRNSTFYKILNFPFFHPIFFNYTKLRENYFYTKISFKKSSFQMVSQE